MQSWLADVKFCSLERLVNCFVCHSKDICKIYDHDFYGVTRSCIDELSQRTPNYPIYRTLTLVNTIYFNIIDNLDCPTKVLTGIYVKIMKFYDCPLVRPLNDVL